MNQIRVTFARCLKNYGQEHSQAIIVDTPRTQEQSIERLDVQLQKITQEFLKIRHAISRILAHYKAHFISTAPSVVVPTLTQAAPNLDVFGASLKPPQQTRQVIVPTSNEAIIQQQARYWLARVRTEEIAQNKSNDVWIAEFTQMPLENRKAVIASMMQSVDTRIKEAQQEAATMQSNAQTEQKRQLAGDVVENIGTIDEERKRCDSFDPLPWDARTWVEFLSSQLDKHDQIVRGEISYQRFAL